MSYKIYLQFQWGQKFVGVKLHVVFAKEVTLKL